MRAAYLVHQEHEDEAQDQRHADAGVKLLVTVLMFPASAQGWFHLTLGLRHFHHSSLTVALVSTCRDAGPERKERGSSKLRMCLLTLLSSITDPGGSSWEAADIQTNTKQILLFDKVGYARERDVTWLFAASWTSLCLKRIQTVTVNTGRHIHTYSMSTCSILRSLTLKTDHYKHRAQQDENRKLMLKPELTQDCCTSWTGLQGNKLLCRLSKLKSWHQHCSNI